MRRLQCGPACRPRPPCCPSTPPAPPAPVAPPRSEIFASSWENEAPAPAAKPDPSVFGTAWDATAADDSPVLTGSLESDLSGATDDAVPLASPSDFLAGAPLAAPSEDISIDADPGEFVVESASAAELATNVRERGQSSIDGDRLELASNSDFIDHSQLTGTGAQWSDDRKSISLEGEEDEGEVIQGMVLEEEEPAPAIDTADSWGTAVSQPSPAPQPPSATTFGSFGASRARFASTPETHSSWSAATIWCWTARTTFRRGIWSTTRAFWQASPWFTAASSNSKAR